MAPIPKLYNSVTDTPLVWPDLCTPTQAADSSAGCSLCRVGLLLSPTQMPTGGECPPKKEGIWGVGEGLSMGILAALPSAFSREPQTLLFPSDTLVCSAFPPPELRVSGCERGFVCGSFKRAPVSVADSHLCLADTIPANFHSQVLCGHLFLALMLRAGEPSLELT